MGQLKKTALFDFDGVIADTEPLYDLFWDNAAERYKLEYDNFSSMIKGTTMPYILGKYFANHSQEEINQLNQELAEFEKNMPFPLIPGIMDFITLLKRNHIKIGLVTSSDNSKMSNAFRALPIKELFDTIVTADRITKGKPDPMCYLLGASDLSSTPSECLVFEDSFAGIQAGNAAGMRVIGISSTNPAETLQDKVYEVIPNFEGITIERYRSW